MRELLGTVIGGEYTLEALLTAAPTASCAWVFRATRRDGEVCAVRLLSPELVSASRYRHRFARELHVAPRLTHPHIVRVLATGEHAGLPYLVMEYLPSSVRQLLCRQGALSELQAVEIIRQLCLGLEYAYQQGVRCHRDLKPDNLLLTTEQTVKIADFGVMEEPDPGEGLLVGTPYYMSPEQRRGKLLDVRSDLYALGCIGYEMLTGAPPFAAQPQAGRGSLPADVLRRCEPALHAATIEVVLTLLAEDPAARYASPAQVREALAALHAPAATTVVAPSVQAEPSASAAPILPVADLPMPEPVDESEIEAECPALTISAPQDTVDATPCHAARTVLERYCLHCGCPNAVEQSYCRTCGYPLLPGDAKCPNPACAYYPEPHDRYCALCGASLSLPAPQRRPHHLLAARRNREHAHDRCTYQSAPIARFCARCGVQQARHARRLLTLPRQAHLVAVVFAAVIVPVAAVAALYLLAPNFFGNRTAPESLPSPPRKEETTVRPIEQAAATLAPVAPEESRVDAQPVRAQPPDATALGRTALEQGRLDDAVRHYREALRQHPGQAEATQCLAWIKRVRDAAQRPHTVASVDFSTDRATPFRGLLAAGTPLYYRVTVRNRWPAVRAAYPLTGNVAERPWFRQMQEKAAPATVSLTVTKRLPARNQQKSVAMTVRLREAETAATGWETLIQVNDWANNQQLAMEMTVAVKGEVLWRDTVRMRGR